MRFRVSCNKGFEEPCARELETLGAANVNQGSGYVTGSGPFELTYVLNRFGRTFDRVFIQMAESALADGNVAEELLSRISSGALGRVSGVTLEADEFVTRLRPRWITQLSSLLPRAFGSRGGRVRLVRGKPDASLLLGVEGESAFLYADTTGDTLNFREYRKYNHPSGLRPTLAASLLLMARPEGGVLYDPFCGGGTILIEAALMSATRPTHERRSYRYRNFTDFDSKVEMDSRPARPSITPFGSFVGSEINSVHLKGCKKNLKTAGDLPVSVALGDCTKTVLKERADVIVTNPPFGVRGSKLNRMKQLYGRFLDNLPNIMKEEGRVVVVTSDFEDLKGALRGRGIPIEGAARTLHSHLWVEGIAFRLRGRRK